MIQGTMHLTECDRRCKLQVWRICIVSCYLDFLAFILLKFANAHASMAILLVLFRGVLELFLGCLSKMLAVFSVIFMKSTPRGNDPKPARDD